MSITVSFKANDRNCQPLRSHHGKNVQPLRSGNHEKRTSFASDNNYVSREEYDKLQAKYDVACRVIASNILAQQDTKGTSKDSLNYIA